MRSATGFVALIALLALSLATVGAINRWQTRRRIERQKLQYLRSRIDFLEEVRAGIAPLLEFTDIPKLLNQEILGLLDSVRRLDPNADYLAPYQERAESLAELFQKQKRSHPLNRILTSDASIAKHLFYLSEAGQELRRIRASERLEAAELDPLMAELAWAHLVVEVASVIGQGNKVGAYQGELFAAPYYRRAHDLLLRSANKDQRRFRLIRELQELIELQRPSISRDLLPDLFSTS